MTFLSKFDAQCSKCRRPILAKRHYITWGPDQRGRAEHYNCTDPCARPPQPAQPPASPRADSPQESLAQAPAAIPPQVPAAPMRSAPVFPLPLVEKYRPSAVADFIGIAEAKSVFAGLLKNPRPCALLLVGPPGVGKTALAMAFAKQLRAGLIHHASAKLTVDAVAQTVESTQYYPESGDWWVVICDEADRMSPQAQTALLSLLDSCNTLFPAFGGGFERLPAAGDEHENLRCFQH